MDSDIKEEDLKEIEEASEIKESQDNMLETRADLARLENELDLDEEFVDQNGLQKQNELVSQGKTLFHRIDALFLNIEIDPIKEDGITTKE